MMTDTEYFRNRIWIHKDLIYRYALWSTADEAEAADVSQEVFLRLWKMKERIKNYNNIEALVIRVTKNICIDLHRKSEKLRSIRANIKPPNDGGQSPFDLTEQKDRIQLFMGIIQSLPEGQRTALHLKSIEGKSAKEIAEITGQKVNTVEVNISRARKKVRTEYLKITGDEND